MSELDEHGLTAQKLSAKIIISFKSFVIAKETCLTKQVLVTVTYLILGETKVKGRMQRVDYRNGELKTINTAT